MCNPWNKCHKRGLMTTGGQIPIEKHYRSFSKFSWENCRSGWKNAGYHGCCHGYSGRFWISSASEIPFVAMRIIIMQNEQLQDVQLCQVCCFHPDLQYFHEIFLDYMSLYFFKSLSDLKNIRLWHFICAITKACKSMTWVTAKVALLSYTSVQYRAF